MYMYSIRHVFVTGFTSARMLDARGQEWTLAFNNACPQVLHFNFIIQFMPGVALGFLVVGEMRVRETFENKQGMVHFDHIQSEFLNRRKKEILSVFNMSIPINLTTRTLNDAS